MEKNLSFDWKILGHKRQLTLLEHFIKSDNLAHAYLFYGRKNLGKNKVVSSFIKTLLCFYLNFSFHKTNTHVLNYHFL
jgi:DNA polymerase III gamma/tau subunit